MSKTRLVIGLMLLGVLLAFSAPAAASPFDPSVVKVSVDDSLWNSYHIAPEPQSGDTITLHRIIKAEVTILTTGNREFATHVFTPKDDKPHRFTIPHGVTNLKVRLKTWTADDVVWTTLVDLKDIGDNLVVKAVRSYQAVYTPGF
ncbi:hypothetical protein [Anaeroselena agilis]|uniref:Uncharacterized protein n=1 Tax=Anaeroselena agilis TaxID=3063788 RepID=A0ABU3NZ62_9FIRM|nr:hypothetical protein [Selenomonadales bacterium 4137-cl]